MLAHPGDQGLLVCNNPLNVIYAKTVFHGQPLFITRNRCIQALNTIIVPVLGKPKSPPSPNQFALKT